jgi:hypothetical protein
MISDSGTELSLPNGKLSSSTAMGDLDVETFQPPAHRGVTCCLHFASWQSSQ